MPMDMPTDVTPFCKFLQWTVGGALWFSLANHVWENPYHKLADFVWLAVAPFFIALIVIIIPLAIGFLAAVLLKYENE